MKINVYSFYDSAAKAYTTPFFMHNDGMAIRGFQDNVNAEQENNMSKHPDQFTLFKIGEFDDQTGAIERIDPHKNLGNGLTYKIESKEVTQNRDILAYVKKVYEMLDKQEQSK